MNIANCAIDDLAVFSWLATQNYIPYSPATEIEVRIHADRQVLFIRQGKGQRDRYVPIGM